MRRGILSGLLRRTTVGVDIGSSSVKVVELSVGSSRQDYRLEKCASELLDRNAVADGNVINIEAVGIALRRALGKAGIRSKDVVLGVPSMLTESQTVSLPDNLSEDELYSQVESEAHRLYPPSQAVNFDFAVIGPSETEGGIGVRVTAANSDRVQERVTAAEMAGLKPQVMDVEEYAVQRSIVQMLGVPQEMSEADARALPVVAVVHLGGSRSKAIFYQGWKELYEQPLNSYGDQLTQSAARMFTLDALKAEIKKRKNTLPEAWRAQLLKPSLDALAMEVQSAIGNFIASSSLGRVDEILLSGGHASLFGVQAAIQHQTKITTTLANPFANMATNAKVNERYLQRDLPAYIVSAGLALRGLQ
ncbi:FIMBRIAL TYPE-4 ASSEMBLY PROTEIN [Cupriavidus taiwanensis]|nr:FIMBRIAL TYPE-4 ASSEMBLY PROTEIN [Cupriavidus taiwanensis]